MTSVLRILDANANRAREALRVMEEAARFLLNDAELSALLKSLRHDLAAALSAIDGLELNRDTPGDVGTTITTASEQSRNSVADVATAAGKRLTEALRAIEEYSKTLGTSGGTSGGTAEAALPGAAAVPQAIEKLRYRAYEAERRLNLALSATRPKQWRLCLLLTESLCTHHTWQDVLRQAIDSGVDCVQVREKQMDAGWLVRRVQDVMEITHAPGSAPGSASGGGATVIVNDRPDVAMAAGAHGVHLGQTDLTCEQVRRLFGRQLIVGVSTSNLDQARRAVAQGADYVGLGPMFPTTTVANKPHIVGPAYVRAFLNEFPGFPHLAIGGLTPPPGSAQEVIAAGARGIAVSSAICSAPNPAQAAAALRALFDDTPPAR